MLVLRSARPLVLCALVAACDVTDGTVIQDPVADGPDAGARQWTPRRGQTWQFQLTGTIEVGVDAEVFDLDLFDAPQAIIDELHAEGRAVVCYLSAGTFEPWRPDADLFPSNALGEPVSGFPEERWLDPRDPTVREVMTSRLDLARSKRCDGVQLSSVDGFQSSTGFAFTGEDQLSFNRFLISRAKERGLMVGLTNDFSQLGVLAAEADFGVLIECVDDGLCESASAYGDKAVFHMELLPQRPAVCDAVAPLGLSTIFKERDIGALRTDCL